jgi:hypothetical protein
MPWTPFNDKMIPVGNGTFKMEGGIFVEMFDVL